MNRFIRVDSYRKEEKSYSLQLKGLRPLIYNMSQAQPVYGRSLFDDNDNYEGGILNTFSIDEKNLRKLRKI